MLPHAPRTLTVLVLLLALPSPVRSTAGFAEWEIETPGGNRVSHVDPLIEEHGTCLRGPAGAAGSERVFVARLHSWVYHPGFVAGRSEGGFFLFDETRRTVRRFATETELVRAVRAAGIGRAAGRRMTPGDGWRMVWQPILEERCRQLDRAEEPFAAMPAEERERMRATICGKLGQGDAEGR
jgi:hypothetical protein